MERYITSVSVGFIIIIVGIVLRRNQVKNTSDKNKPSNKARTFPLTIRAPKSDKYVGLMAILIIPVSFVFTMVVSPDTFTNNYDSANQIKYLILSLFLMMPLGIYFLLRFVNFKVEVFRDKFIYTNLFRIRQEYHFSQIKRKEKNSCYRIYRKKKGSKLKHVLGLSYADDELLKALRQYNKSNNKNN